MARVDGKFAHSHSKPIEVATHSSCSASAAQRPYLQSINREPENESNSQLNNNISGRNEFSGIAQLNQEYHRSAGCECDTLSNNQPTQVTCGNNSNKTRPPKQWLKLDKFDGTTSLEVHLAKFHACARYKWMG